MVKIKPLEVFISSTCYDLVDLRSELSEYLKERGCVVRLSDDPHSAFFVDPAGDSIQSCLRSLEACDVVVCVIDGRYGPSLPEIYRGQSALEVEVRHANDLVPPKKVFYFIRDFAEADYHQLRKDESYRPKWVEKGNPANARNWTQFVDYVFTLDPGALRSNWVDRFKASVDLKPLVLSRLQAHFPLQLAFVALRPERLVRLTFSRRIMNDTPTLFGHFENVGVGPALNIVHGWAVSQDAAESVSFQCGGLAEGAKLVQAVIAGTGDWAYASATYAKSACVFCEYSNRFQDRYRVEVLFDCKNGKTLEQVGPERFYVATNGADGMPRWCPVGDS